MSQTTETPTKPPEKLPAVVKPPAPPVAQQTLSEIAEYGSFENDQVFAHVQRVAKMLCQSALVPEAYRGEKNLPNVIIALDISRRQNVPPLSVMQNLHIIDGKPTWSSQWIIARINGCGRFSPLRYTIEHLGRKEVTYEYTKWDGGQKSRQRATVEIDNIQCIARATEKETGEELESSPVTVELAVKEGWYGKSGSKWQTMPLQMIRYRAAAFFGRIYCPELLLGMLSEEEVIDITPDRPDRPSIPAPHSTDEAPATTEVPEIPAARGEESQVRPEGEEPARTIETVVEPPATNGKQSEPKNTAQPYTKPTIDSQLEGVYGLAHPDDLLTVKSTVGAEGTDITDFLKLSPELKEQAKQELGRLTTARHKRAKR